MRNAPSRNPCRLSTGSEPHAVMALEQPQPQPQSQSKRNRRPSVRLGEIGELGFTASRLESKQQRRKQSLLEEEWSVVEPAVATASPVVSAPTGKRRSSGARLRWAGSKVHRFQENDAAARSDRARDDRDESPVSLLAGSGSKEQIENGASEEANPNFQGAIEDGPHGRGAERRSVRPIVKRKHRTPSRDPSVAGEAFANGTVVITPSSSQGLALSAGVTGWLQELGLGKYADFFEYNEVDTEVLPLLTMDDLREMGIDAVGARRKMFSNIQALRRN